MVRWSISLFCGGGDLTPRRGSTELTEVRARQGILETGFVFLASSACSAVNSVFASFMDGILSASAGGVGDGIDFLGGW
jgi:hypothetical protein